MPRWLGPALVVVGVLALIVGGIGTFGGGGSEAAAETTTTTVGSEPPGEADPGSTTTTVTDTTSSTSATTTSPATTSSTSTTVPTTTTVPAETVEEFVVAYNAALESGDNDFVFATLHPVVVESWGEDLCRAWVDREVMELSDYRLVEVVDGPKTQSLSTPAGGATVDDYYDATVAFVFQGTEFEVAGAFALVGPDMHWLGQCR